MLYQIEGRHHRVIGVNNLRHAKETVYVMWVVPQFTESFLDMVQDGRLREILSNGTLVEQTHRRVEGGRIVYNFVMEGYGEEKDLEPYFHRKLLEGLGLTAREKFDYERGLRESTQRIVHVAEAFLPIWSQAEGMSAAREGMLELIAALRFYPVEGRNLGETLSRHGIVDVEDLAFCSKLFEVENKYVRERLLKLLPNVIERAYSQGKRLHELCSTGALTVEGFVSEVLPWTASNVFEREHSTYGRALADTIASMRDTPAKRKAQERFLIGGLAALQCPDAQELLRQNNALISSADFESQLTVLYRVGLLARTNPGLITQCCAVEFTSFADLASEVERSADAALDEYIERTPGTARAAAEHGRGWTGPRDCLLALLAGYQEMGNEEILAQYKECLQAVFDDQYREFRYDDSRKEAGSSISFLQDEPEFWPAFAENSVLHRRTITIDPAKEVRALRREYNALRKEVAGQEGAVEGGFVRDELARADGATIAEKAEARARFEADRAKLGRIIGALHQDRTPAEESLEVAKRYGLMEEGDLNSLPFRVACERKVEELQGIIGWLVLDEEFSTLTQTGEFSNSARVKEILEKKASFFVRTKHDKLAEPFYSLRQRIRSREQHAARPLRVTIREADDAEMFARMGALEDDLSNCFNPNGNPMFNQYVVCALGSKNMKLIIVQDEDDGRFLACAMMKVRKDSKDRDAQPVFYLERGLAAGAYDFREEMLELLDAKAKAMGETTICPRVMAQVHGQYAADESEVYGIGAYTRDEYVEATFGWRSSAKIHHKARQYVKARGLTNGAGDQFAGIGTSNKTIGAYIQELQEMGTRVVVDVRDRPSSQYYPHFNHNVLAEVLRENGIDYVWMGNTLGNPRDDNGRRTLEGFKLHMESPRYQEGMEALVELLHSGTGPIAITCSEGNERECHRQFILEDLRKRLGDSGK